MVLLCVHLIKEAYEMGGNLFFPRYDVLEFVDSLFEQGEIKGLHDLFLSDDKKERGAEDNIRYQEGGELQTLLLLDLRQLLLQLIFFLVKFVEADRFDLTDAEFSLFCRKGLVIAVYHRLNASGLYTRCGGKYLLSEGPVVETGMLFKPGHDLPVTVGRGRRAENDRIGEHTGEEEAGDLFFGGEPLSPIEFRDEGRGAADGLADKGNGVGGMKVPQPVVIDDFADIYLVGAVHRLGEFVMVDKDKPRCGGDEEAALGNNPLEGADAVEDDTSPLSPLCHALPDGLHRLVGRDGEKVAIADPVYGVLERTIRAVVAVS